LEPESSALIRVAPLTGRGAWAVKRCGDGFLDGCCVVGWAGSRRITELEEAVVELTRHAEECREELGAARAANREMIAQMNPGSRPEARAYSR
jgi:hypothetical protein